MDIVHKKLIRGYTWNVYEQYILILFTKHQIIYIPNTCYPVANSDNYEDKTPKIMSTTIIIKAKATIKMSLYCDDINRNN